MVLAYPAVDFGVSGRCFWRVEQVAPACSAGCSDGSGRCFPSVRGVVPASHEHASGTSEMWFRPARQVFPRCPPSGTGVVGR
ncbi:hypothetical protein A2U09_11035 [Fusobacterium necrophorum subsp. funduliforme]|nr:hypothetical protein A2U09_11035 [Fusobacterium necrophorum subsp. funduliforme]